MPRIDMETRAGASLSGERALFGHPKGLAFLFGAEMWERFSYYGMRALLVLYMVDYLLVPERMGSAIGLTSLKRALEFFTGPLATQPFASLIYGLYTGCVYLTPMLGGWLADRHLGRRRTIALGAALMVAGHFMMAFDSMFLIALSLIALGCGAFKPNITTQVGELYAPADPRRDRAYSIFYVGINIGAFLAPLVCGTLGERIGWHYGFAVAGVGMAAGFASYLAGAAHLPQEQPRKATAPESALDFRRALLSLLLLFLPSALFWAAFEQQGNAIVLFIAGNVDRSAPLVGAEIPITWFQALNPLMIFLFTPPLVGLWSRLGAAGREPSTLRKLTMGCLGVSASYGVLAYAAFASDGGKASWLWLLVYFAVITLSELHFSPITLSLVSRVAPQGARSALMGFWFTSMFVGNLAAGWLGSFWSRMTHVQFFETIALLGLVAALIVEAARRALETVDA